MEVLTANFWCYYLTQWEGVEPQQAYWDASKIVKALKGEKFNGYLRWKVGGNWRDFTSANIDEFLGPLFKRIGKLLRDDIKGPVSVVPIPNSKMAVGAKGTFRTVELATLLVDGLGDDAVLCPAIRWDKPREPSHKKNEYRYPDLYQPHMRLAAKPTSPVIIMDDVLTSGSQMIAATRFLTEAGYKVRRGVTVARATSVPKKPMFGWTSHELRIAAEDDDDDEEF
jgi:hypothetical protein